jgi:hypothetical protein
MPFVIVISSKLTGQTRPCATAPCSSSERKKGESGVLCSDEVQLVLLLEASDMELCAGDDKSTDSEATVGSAARRAARGVMARWRSRRDAAAMMRPSWSGGARPRGRHHGRTVLNRCTCNRNRPACDWECVVLLHY